MVRAHWNLNDSRDLTMRPFQGWFVTCGLALATTYLPNLKSLTPPTMKIRKAIQNIENGEIWGS